MNYILFDTNNWNNLLPLTYTRPVSELRVGILTIKEKWNNFLNTNISNITKDYLNTKFKTRIEEENILINSSIIPNQKLVEQINKLEINQILEKEGLIIALKLNKKATEQFNFEEINLSSKKEFEGEFTEIKNTWDIFSKNKDEIKNDFILITKGRKSEKISKTNKVFETENIFIEKGAKIECAILNPDGGYIYIGKNAEIMEGSIVRGSLAMCENSVLKLATKIYGATTIGPFSKVGGEINNCVITGYSSKAHDGFLGNSVLGEWCNIGADTNNSNLKNNYAEVRLWDYGSGRFAKTGLQFCGLIMGDHSKCGINTMFNTGTVIGVSANIYGSGFPRNFVPSFSWGGAAGFTEYKLNKVFEVAEIVMKRRNLELSQTEKDILSHVFEISQKWRK